MIASIRPMRNLRPCRVRALCRRGEHQLQRHAQDITQDDAGQHVVIAARMPDAERQPGRTPPKLPDVCKSQARCCVGNRGTQRCNAQRRRLTGYDPLKRAVYAGIPQSKQRRDCRNIVRGDKIHRSLSCVRLASPTDLATPSQRKTATRYWTVHFPSALRPQGGSGGAGLPSEMCYANGFARSGAGGRSRLR